MLSIEQRLWLLEASNFGSVPYWPCDLRYIISLVWVSVSLLVNKCWLIVHILKSTVEENIM